MSIQLFKKNLNRVKILIYLTSFVFVSMSQKLTWAKGLKVQAHDELVITGFYGNLRVIKHGKPVVEVTSSGSDKLWKASLYRNNSRIFVNVNGPDDKSIWSDKKLWKKVNVTIKSPSLPTRITWHKGHFKLSQWSSPVVISWLGGKTEISQTESSIRLFQQSGIVNIRSHTGALKLDCYSAAVSLEEVNGPIHLENMLGSSRLKKLNGAIQLKLYKGPFLMEESEGALDFTSSLSKVEIKRHKGEVKGQSKQGPVVVSGGDLSKIRLTTESGSVRVALGGQGGGYANLGSAKGSISAPNYLKTRRFPSLKLVQGQLRGPKSRRVYVRTQTGAISLH